MDELELKVTIEEANLILEGVGRLPFAKVYALVAKIQEQAGRQLGHGQAIFDDARDETATEDAAGPSIRAVED